MKRPTKLKCEVAGCTSGVPASLASLRLCLDHCLSGAMEGLEQAVAACREGHGVPPESLERLRVHADFAVKYLTEHGAEEDESARETAMQFLLGLANLHEYLSHNAAMVGRAK